MSQLFLVIIVIVVVGLSAIVVVLCHNCFYNNDKKCYRNSKITVGVIVIFIIFGGIVNICHFLLLISVCCNFGKCKRVLVTQTIYIKNGCIIISLWRSLFVCIYCLVIFTIISDCKSQVGLQWRVKKYIPVKFQ